MRYFLHRFRQATFLLIGVSILTFLFSALAPGNYFDEMRLNPQISPETVAALRAQYQLDRPLPVRYVRWVNSLLHGRNGLLLCLQQSSCAAAVGARPKHVAAHGNRNSDGVGARSSPGNLERHNSRALAGSSSFRSDCGTLGNSGPRACARFAHSRGPHQMVSNGRNGLRRL